MTIDTRRRRPRRRRVGADPVVPDLVPVGRAEPLDDPRPARLARPAHAHRARPRLAPAVLALARPTPPPSSTRCSTTSRSRSATAPSARWRSASRDPDRAAEKLLARGLVGGDRQDGRRRRARRHRRRAFASRSRRTRSRSCAGWVPATRSGARSATGCCRGGTSCAASRAGNAAGAIVASRLMCADDMPYPGGSRCRTWMTTRWRHLVAHPCRAAAPGARAPAHAARAAPLLTDGALFIVAADHTARGMLGVPGDPFAMADRRRTLEALMVALAHPGCDGVLASADIMEDLAAARRARRQARLRHDEPGRDHGRGVGARRPHDRLQRRRPRRQRPRRRQGAAAARRRRRRHGTDARGVRPRRRRVRRPRACRSWSSRCRTTTTRPPGRPSCSTTRTPCCAPSPSAPASDRRRPRRGSRCRPARTRSGCCRARRCRR